MTRQGGDCGLPVEWVEVKGLRSHRQNAIHEETVKSLRSTPLEEWPSVCLLESGGRLLVVDGKHRIRAARLRGARRIKAHVHGRGRE